MGAFSEEQLAHARDQSRAWLRQQPGYTGSYIGRKEDGSLVLVLQFHPVNPEISRVVEQRFANMPVEIRDMPAARAY